MVASNAESWMPGTVHPTGDYDRIVKQPFETLYYRGGDLHRLDGPAQISVSDSVASYRVENWRFRGRLHRDGGPAVTHYDHGGAVVREDYFVHGVLSREDGPTTTTYRDDGGVDSRVWRSGGVLHRIDGPAEIEYDAAGRVRISTYALRGKHLTEQTFERFREALESGSPEEWALAYALGETQ